MSVNGNWRRLLSSAEAQDKARLAYAIMNTEDDK